MHQPARFSLLAVVLALAGCEQKSAPAPAASTSATPSASAAAAMEVTAKDLDMLSHRKAKEVLVSRGWRAANASTGPSEGAFSISSDKKDGSRVDVGLFVFDSALEKKMTRPRAIEDAAFVEHGKKLLSVRVKKAGKADEAAGKALLDALATRARNPEEPFAVVEPKGKSWLEPSIETVDAHLVISPELVERTVAALKALGYDDASKGSEQKRDTKNPKDTGHPGVSVHGRQGDESVHVSFRCLPEDTSSHFFPKPHDADLGEAIYTKERCKAVVSVKPASARWSDKKKAKALLEKLFAHQPKDG